MVIAKKSLGRFRHYPFRAIDPDAASRLLAAAARLENPGGESHTLSVHLLEAFCDLSGQPLKEADLLRPEMAKVYDDFCGAMHSRTFIQLPPARTSTFCRMLSETIEGVRGGFGIEWSAWNHKRIGEVQRGWISQNVQFQETKITYWKGWPVENRQSDDPTYLNLARLCNSHGEHFTSQLHTGIRQYQQGAASRPNHMVIHMIRFLESNCEEWPRQTFQDPKALYNFFAAFMKSEFKNFNDESENLESHKKNWNKMIGTIYTMFINSRIWATPYRHLPLTDAKAIKGHKTNIGVDRFGIKVKTKLITPIPLHITERTAVKQLTLRIREDIQAVRSWATSQSLMTVRKFDERKNLALEATTDNWQDSRFYNENFMSNIAAAFEKSSYDLEIGKINQYLKIRTPHRIKASHICSELGIPATSDMYPFQCLLILEHPSITNSFLENYDLYDKYGDMTGFVSEGGKSYLALGVEDSMISGIKNRKGENLGRQKFELTSTATQVMWDVIKITLPARNYLKSIGDEKWKKLFIASHQCACRPRIARIPRWNNSTLVYQCADILEQFLPHTHAREDELFYFLAQVSPSTIRASRAVEEYLDTGSTHMMSECLGHEVEDSVLLESYLPRIFLDLIEEQGVRFVQKSMICNSLRNSAFLVKGANFSDPRELEAVLDNERLTSLPDHLTNPDYLNEKDTNRLTCEIIIRIGVGSLTALLSLQQAVMKAKDQRLISESIMRWAKLAPLLTIEIEGSSDADLKEKLRLAQLHANPRLMEKIIYEH